MDFKDIIWITVGVAIIMSILGFSATSIDWIVNLGMSIAVSALLTAISSGLVESFTGNTLKKYLLTIKFKGIKFSFSLFAIITVILKMTLF